MALRKIRLQGDEVPVSYTHLDVYKRQIQDLLYGKIMFKVCRISETIGKFIKEL